MDHNKSLTEIRILLYQKNVYVLILFTLLTIYLYLERKTFVWIHLSFAALANYTLWAYMYKKKHYICIRLKEK